MIITANVEDTRNVEEKNLPLLLFVNFLLVVFVCLFKIAMIYMIYHNLYDRIIYVIYNASIYCI